MGSEMCIRDSPSPGNHEIKFRKRETKRKKRRVVKEEEREFYKIQKQHELRQINVFLL